MEKRTMKKWIIMILMLACLTACGDSDLPENYEIVGDRVLAVRIEEPEAAPGDTVALSLLVGGNGMARDSSIPVTWIVGDPEGGFYLRGTSPYNEPLPVVLPDGVAVEHPVGVPVYAEMSYGGKTYSALKRFRITSNPTALNPRILGIECRFFSDGDPHSTVIADNGTLQLDYTVRTAAFTVSTETLAEGANDTLVYSWYVTFSTNSPGKLKVDGKKDHIETLLGEGAKAAEYRPSVVFSLYGEDAGGVYQKGRYTVYIVVRDNAADAENPSEDRLGTDYFSFTLEAL
jgi:hypothetical protein